ncbi:MAG: 50S ribosomal protein L13 [Deltaproteobacteria bacterium]|nr:50S ribosomal protein L13 [Deltaproteobacteria bacterium]
MSKSAKITKSYKKIETNRQYHIVDLKDKVLGRVASEIAKILRGKNKAIFTPNQDVGDFVIAINAKDIKLTGNKVEQKHYAHHSGYIGGIKEYNAKVLLEKKPEEIIRRAVQGMLPKKSPLAKQQLKKLKIYPTSEHPHQAQKPQNLELA